MKKIILFLTVFVMTVGMVYAQRIKVVSGSLDFLKSEKELDISFSYDGLRVGKMTEEDYTAKKVNDYNNKETAKGDNWLVAWNLDKTNRYEPKFIELFNKYMEERLQIDSDSRYQMQVNADFIEPGYNIGISRRNASVNLTVVFIDTETVTEAAIVTITNSSANDFMGTDFDSAYRIQESFGKAGRELAKFLIKKCKL